MSWKYEVKWATETADTPITQDAVNGSYLDFALLHNLKEVKAFCKTEYLTRLRPGIYYTRSNGKEYLIVSKDILRYNKLPECLQHDTSLLWQGLQLVSIR